MALGSSARPRSKSGLPHTILPPGAFATNSLNWAGAIRVGEAVVVAYPDAQLSPVHEDDLAKVAVSILDEGTYQGQSLVLTGPESLSFRQQVLRSCRRTCWKAFSTIYAASDGVPARISDTIERVTGTPARTYRQWVRDHLAEFSG